MNTKRLLHNKLIFAYAGLILVIITWGVTPLTTLYFLNYFSSTAFVIFNSFVPAIFLLILNRKKLGELNKYYFLAAIPTGISNSLGEVLQKIGLYYTTPTHYAFLENLSCIVIPVLLFFFIKKKPSLLTIFSSVLCLLSCFILSGIYQDASVYSLTGDLLCALAGISFGINIAGTGAFAGKLHAPLYLMIQMFAGGVVSAVGGSILHFTGFEQLRFSFDLPILLFMLLYSLFVYTICWLLRTAAMKHIDATIVGIMMPFSAVVTTILSILIGADTLSPSLVIGAALGLIAVILSGLGARK